jgi:hypothetical protein
VLFFAVSVLFYYLSLETAEENHFFDHVSHDSLREVLQSYEMMKMLPEFDDLKSRFFSDGSMDGMVQALRDFSDERAGMRERANRDSAEINAPEEIWNYQEIIYNFFSDIFEHIAITDEQIIGIESLSHEELAEIKADELYRQHEPLTIALMLRRTYDTSYFGYLNSFFPEEYQIESLDFLDDVVFTEFMQTGKAFDAEKSEFLYYYTIRTEDGKGLVIGDMSGTEWVFRIGYGENGQFRRLMPLDMYLNESEGGD